MDVGLMHVTPYSKADPAKVAQQAEELGFESYWVGDHSILPVESSVPTPEPSMMAASHTTCRSCPIRLSRWRGQERPPVR
jgi:alkanesulfonate monooxygenase SsuD/methylene tetrahydromethanopterin reductase-like flavin-dependent oxidoreductase (luciferase family)